ncbi:hypothetical protein [Rufibacter sp. LB8]|uniref:hypothetical protein n=1 Tax=Rufibacter sp. LB8 TaxID=2777781 RepID=UPI00178C63EE|nr:hypothetical protein [Rufibacter sp. LB8]
MPRKIRSDITIGNLEKKLGLDKGAIRNPDGSDARSDKKLGTLREEYQQQFGGPPVRKSKTAPKTAVNAKNKAAAKKPKGAPSAKKATPKRKK